MNAFFKNPWTWLLILFMLVAGSVGIFLFRGNSARVVENGGKAVKEVKEEKLSQEDSESIVKKLEEGSLVPGEAESGEEITKDQLQMTNEEKEGEVKRITNGEVSIANGGEKKEGEKTEGAVGKLSVMNQLVSWGFAKANDRKIDTVVLHSTYNATGGDSFSVSKIIAIYKSYGVSPHYLVARDGTVYRLVEEKNIAYHAGDSKMSDGRKDVNTFSIGIEIIGKDDGSPSDEQYAALEKLLPDIKSRNNIKHIVGHRDIAPGRKSDPWGFDWKKIGGKEL